MFLSSGQYIPKYTPSTDPNTHLGTHPVHTWYIPRTHPVLTQYKPVHTQHAQDTPSTHPVQASTHPSCPVHTQYTPNVPSTHPVHTQAHTQHTLRPLHLLDCLRPGVRMTVPELSRHLQVFAGLFSLHGPRLLCLAFPVLLPNRHGLTTWD